MTTCGLTAICRRSPTRQLLMVSMSYVPTCRPRSWTPTRRCAPTKAWPASSAPSVASKRRSGSAASVPLDRAAGARPCLPLHAGLPCRMAYASGVGADPVCRPRSRRRRGAQALSGRQGQAVLRRPRKAASKRTDDGLPVHSFRSLMADLATLTRNTVVSLERQLWRILAKPTPVQRRAFELLAIKPKM